MVGTIPKALCMMRGGAGELYCAVMVLLTAQVKVLDAGACLQRCRDLDRALSIQNVRCHRHQSHNNEPTNRIATGQLSVLSQCHGQRNMVAVPLSRRCVSTPCLVNAAAILVAALALIWLPVCERV